VAGKKITVGRCSVEFGPQLEEAVDRLVRDIAGDMVDLVENLADELATNARKEWYRNVTKRTGKSGAGNDYRIEVRGDRVQGVVFNDAKQGMKDPKTQGMFRRQFIEANYAYYVHRPGPFSTQLQRLNDVEYRELMSFWKRTGTLPDGYVAERMTDSQGRRRPVGVSKAVDNPERFDGKNLWKLLVLDPSKIKIKQILPDIDKAMMASARRFAKGG
jgi:hypothetical protein